MTERSALDLVNAKELFRDYKEYVKFTQLYEAAIKQLTTRLEILNSECGAMEEHNPIHHIYSRLKSVNSIVEKLNKRGYEVSAESAMHNLNDIAGLRVVCGYLDDVYRVADMLLRQSDIVLVDRTDYIESPNYNGYRSLHLDVEIPVFLAERTEYVTAEIQIRTVAMDFWATLEHDLRYKNLKTIPPEICSAMLGCANEIADIEKRMQDVYKEIQALD